MLFERDGARGRFDTIASNQSVAVVQSRFPGCTAYPQPDLAVSNLRALSPTMREGL